MSPIRVLIVTKDGQWENEIIRRLGGQVECVGVHETPEIWVYMEDDSYVLIFWDIWPGLGLKAAARKVKEIRRKNNNARIVVVIQIDGNKDNELISRYARDFLTAGASDFLPKNEFFEEFDEIWNRYGPSGT